MLKRLTAFLLVIVLVFACVSFAQAATYTTLRKGMKGTAVKTMQTALKNQGFYTGKLDGIFGNGTLSAVKAFQTKYKLKVDGIAGNQTLTKLYSLKATPKPTATPKPKATATPKPSASAVPEKVETLLNSVVKKAGAKNGVLVLSKNGKTFLTWSFGGATAKTCYRIASVTKWVTAIGLMTLYDAGKLDLDKDISDYLGFKVRNPAFPNVKITARMLLSHTSSLSPDASVYHPDWARISKKYDPLFNEKVKPGTKYAYADYNGALFGCLIEAISRQGVQAYLNSKVFKPLGVTAAYSPKFLPSGTPTKDLLDKNGKVKISVATDRKRAYNTKADPKGNNGYTVGKLFISAEGLTKLAQMMYNGGSLNGKRILKKSTVTLMESDQKGLASSPYGLSTVRLDQFPRGTWYGHQGRYSGLTSNIYYQRETGITMALIMNGYDWKLEDNIVVPAVTILNNMAKIEKYCLK